MKTKRNKEQVKRKSLPQLKKEILKEKLEYEITAKKKNSKEKKGKYEKKEINLKN